MNFIALEFDDSRIRVAAARLVAKRVRLQHALLIDIDQEDANNASEKLKQALANRRIGKADALVIVQRSCVEIRELNLPPAPDNELPDMVRFIARNEFASLNDSWLLDFVPLSNDPAAPRKVLASGLSPERQKQVLKIVEGAGLKVKHILLRPFESFSLMQPQLAAGKRSLLVDLGDTQVDMMVSVDRSVVATRTVRVAERVSESRTNQILSEINRTALSSENVLGNRGIEEVILLGDSVESTDLADRIRQRMQVEVRVVHPFDLIDRDLNQAPAGQPAQYSALLGSLLQQAAGTRHAIDYLNPRRPVVKTNVRQRVYLFGGLAAAIALLASLFGWWLLRSQGLEIAALNQKLEQIVERNKGDQANPGVEQIIGEVNTIDDWKLSGINWLDEIYEDSKRFLTPDDAIVDVFDASIRQRSPSLSLKGRTASNTRQKLVNSLSERYDVTAERWEPEEQDPNYPEPFDLKLAFEINKDDQLKALDVLANDYFKQQKELRSKTQ
jgi:Tfp pilus assembly PilM family ATPase